MVSWFYTILGVAVLAGLGTITLTNLAALVLICTGAIIFRLERA